MSDRTPLPEERRLRFERALLEAEDQTLEGATEFSGGGYRTWAVLLADGETVARVPRFDEAAQDLEVEMRLLEVLARSDLPQGTPRNPRALVDDGGLVGALHVAVPGGSSDEIPNAEPEVRRAFVTDLIDFVSSLHAIPQSRLEGRAREDVRAERYTRWSGIVSPHLSRDAASWLEARLTRLHTIERPASIPAVLAHCDLWGSNTLVDPEGRLTGVIDFGDAMLTDPAYDLFTFAPRFDEEGLRLALERYRGPLDDHAVERASIYREMDDLYDLAYHVEAGLPFEGPLTVIEERAAGRPPAR
ncbi:MAG: aminoglycoside phosphotransferase family protein [Dehalococcoidia bacterium]